MRRREYLKRLKEDPERFAKFRAYHKAHYQLRSAKPGFREAKREYDRSPEAVAKRKERAKRARADLERSPKKLAEHRERYRLYGYEARRRNGARELGGRGTIQDKARVCLDPVPFREWCRRMIPEYGSLEEFGEIIDVDQRQIGRLFSGVYDTVVLDVVDRALSREGTTFLAELYPELYPDATPEVLYMLRVAAIAEGHVEVNGVAA